MAGKLDSKKAPPPHSATSEEENMPLKRLIIVGNIKPISLDGNLSQNWKKWLQIFTIFLKASGIYDENDSRKVTQLLDIGTECLEIFNTFNVGMEKETFKDLVTKFEQYFMPNKNITYECYQFFTTRQKADESLEDFPTSLINKIKSCEFGNLQDRMKSIFL